MAMHATERADFVERRLLSWLKEPDRAFPGLTPDHILHVDQTRSAKLPTSPRIRVTFAPQEARWSGKVSSTQTAHLETTLLVIDLFWPAGGAGKAFNLYDPSHTASVIKSALSYLNLSFLDYTDPANPATVDNAAITIRRPVTLQRLSNENNLRRWQVRAFVEWFSRTDDRFAS